MYGIRKKPLRCPSDVAAYKTSQRGHIRRVSLSQGLLDMMNKSRICGLNQQIVYLSLGAYLLGMKIFEPVLRCFQGTPKLVFFKIVCFQFENDLKITV